MTGQDMVPYDKEPTTLEFFQLLQRVEKSQAKMEKLLGDEGFDEHGQPIGTGLVGRVARLEAKVEKRFRLYDDWRNYAVAMVATASLFLTALWWLIQTKVEHILK